MTYRFSGFQVLPTFLPFRVKEKIRLLEVVLPYSCFSLISTRSSALLMATDSTSFLPSVYLMLVMV